MAEVKEQEKQNALPDRILYFSTQFVDWILTKKKRATTRVDNFKFEEDGTYEKVGDLRKGDKVRALDDEEKPFAVLTITKVEKRSYGSLDDRLAQIENFKDKKALCDALAKFYKDLKHDSELVVIYFDVDRPL